MLDGEGGYTVYGKLIPATDSKRLGGLPIGLAHKVKMLRDVAAGKTVTWKDVVIDAKNEAVRFRRDMEKAFAQ
jgi:predicted homoserine dehydrogenase-like protein